MDDPIVFPGQPGASHLHDFFGNKSTDAFSTTRSMLAGDTTCRVASDTAGYWSPTAYLNGRQIKPTVMRIYYLGRSDVPVGTIPAGLQIIGGNKLATSPEENPHVHWFCGETLTQKTPLMPEPYDCRPYAAQYAFVTDLIASIDLPSCWDGTGLGPDAVAYPDGGACPAGFPHAIPKLSERLHFPLLNPLNPDGTVALTLSSGPFYTMHADFWNTWQQERLDELVQTCLDAHIRCRSIFASAEIAWTSQFGTIRYDVATAVTESDKAVYVGGFTNYRLPGQRFHHRTDAFLRAYGQNGNIRWTRQFGTSGVDQALAVATAEGAVYVAGFTDGRFPKQEAKGGEDAFVAKFAPDGRQLWLRQIGTPKDDRATSIAVGQGGVYVAGTTGGALVRGHRPGGGTDAFAARLTPTGDIAWIRQFGSRGTDRASGICALGPNAYVAGSTDGALAWGGAQGGLDAFLRRVRADGRTVWTRRFGTVGNDMATSVACHGGSIYVAGSTDGTFPGATPAGGLDAFVARFGRLGDPGWVDQFGSPGDEEAASVVADRGGVYVAGSTTGALSGQAQLGTSDAFVRKDAPKGETMWTMQFGTNDYDRVHGEALDSRGLFVVGETHGAFEGQTNAGDRDAFVTRIRFT